MMAGRWLAILLMLALAAPPSGASPTAGVIVLLRDVTVERQANGVVVQLQTTGQASYQHALLPTPYRVVIDLEDTVYAWRNTPLAVGAEPLRQIRGSQYKETVTRVVLELSRKTAYRIEERSDGLAVKLEPAPKATQEPDVTPAKPNGAPKAVTAEAPKPAVKPAPVPVEPAVRPFATRPSIRLAQAPGPAPQAPTPPAGQPLISMDFKDTDLVNLFRILAAERGQNIVVGADVKGKISITLKNVTWDVALETILEARGLRKIEKDNVIRIVTLEQIAKEEEAKAKAAEAKLKAEAELRTKIAEAQLKEQEVQQRKLAAEAARAEAQARGPLKEETIRLSYADPEDVARTLIGILGIPPEGVVPVTTAPLAPPIAEPPFSALYGPGAQAPPPPPVSPSAEVLAKGITIRAHKPTNSIFIRHFEADLERIKKLIKEKLDIPLPQVKIEARMEILDRADLSALGIRWGGGGAITTEPAVLVGRGFTTGQTTTGGIGVGKFGAGSQGNPNLTLTSALPVSAETGLPAGGNIVNLPISSLLGAAASAGTGGFAFGIIGSKLNINLALEALRTQRKTLTLARPEIVTVENSKASISLGEEIPFATISSAGTQISFKDALLKLEVTPTVIREEAVTKIKMKVVVENNSRGTTVSLGNAGEPPAINKRRAETEVLIKEGERLVIGGVTNDVDDEEIRKVPLLGDIPILGWLFKHRGTQFTGRELVVFITPTVLKPDTPQRAPREMFREMEKPKEK